VKSRRRRYGDSWSSSAARSSAATSVTPVSASATFHFALHHRQHVGDAGFAARGDGIAPGAAEHAGPGAEGQRLDHVEAAAHAAVHQHFEPVADGIGDARQGGDAGGDAVELAAAVVGDDDAVDAGLGGFARVLDVEDALQHDPAWPVLAHPGQVLPGHARVELAVHPGLEFGQAARVGHRRGQVAEGQRLALDGDVEQPAGCESRSQALLSLPPSERPPAMPLRTSR
jgi:hypothetical protein